MLVMSKEIRINVRTTGEVKNDLKVAARVHGLTPSSWINLLVVRGIREAKQLDPQAFHKITRPDGKVAPKSKQRVPLLDSEESKGRRHKTG
jgi:hypothetical protein